MSVLLFFYFSSILQLIFIADNTYVMPLSEYHLILVCDCALCGIAVISALLSSQIFSFVVCSIFIRLLNRKFWTIPFYWFFIRVIISPWWILVQLSLTALYVWFHVKFSSVSGRERNYSTELQWCIPGITSHKVTFWFHRTCCLIYAETLI